MKILDVPSSGSIAGQTYSRNRFGQYRRTRAVPVNPNTAAQTAVRATLSGCSQNWATLEPEEMAAWSAWAALHPRTDSLGQVYTMTGAMAFNSVNCMLILLGLSAVTAPPNDPLPDPPTLGELTVTNDAGTFGGGFTFAPTPLPALTRLVAYVSPPKSGGCQFNRDFRYIGNKAPAGASPMDFTGAYTLKFGTPALGLAIFARARLVRTDGGMSPWSNVVRGIVASP